MNNAFCVNVENDDVLLIITLLCFLLWTYVLRRFPPKDLHRMFFL